MFIRVPNSNQGYFDVTVGTRGQVLMSNGEDVAPSFQDQSVGTPVRGFSYTQDWEKTDLDAFDGFDFGVGNFTAEFERTAAGATGHGPAAYTSPHDFPWARRI